MSVGVIDGGVANVVGSAVIVALGILALLPAPRDRPQRAFAAMALGLGIGTGASNLVFTDADWANVLMWGLLGAGHVVALLGLVGFVAALTGRPRGRELAIATAAFAILTAVLASGYLRPAELRSANEAAGFAWNLALAPSTLAAVLFFAAAWTAAIALARWARDKSAADREQAAILAMALMPYPAVIGTMGVRIDAPLWRGLVFGSMLAAALASLAWLQVARRAGRRPALAAALAPPVFVTLGMLANLETAPWSAGASRVVMTALVAYAILRYHAFGIHATLRFGISKSTIAAVFIAVFFIASEAAQQFLGDTLGSTYVGIAAAGALVFAMAPLQRAAERLAERAVPSAGPGSATVAQRSTKEEAYRRALRIALRDRVISRAEEVHLHDVAEHMGIGAGRAMALRVEIEQELADGKAPAS